ncbi:MAG: hypothetical protein HQK54_10390 [Oligoflexales bacterium]|nr:hypothetical protein [Oligoflexales bacterium]
MMRSLLIPLGIALSIIIASESALGKSTKRTGFNFGNSVTLIESEQPSIMAGSTDSKGKNTSNIQTIKPYVGYVFGDFLNLGLHMNIEKIDNRSNLNGANENEKIDSTRSSQINGGGLFGRFLFGEVLFIESGAGFYERKTLVESEYVSNYTDGSFVGRREETKVRSTGLGYHFGIGLETPVAYNFFFTTSYFLKTYLLKPVEVIGTENKDPTIDNTREVSFGFSYYYQ